MSDSLDVSWGSRVGQVGEVKCLKLTSVGVSPPGLWSVGSTIQGLGVRGGRCCGLGSIVSFGRSGRGPSYDIPSVRVLYP